MYSSRPISPSSPDTALRPIARITARYQFARPPDDQGSGGFGAAFRFREI